MFPASPEVPFLSTSAEVPFLSGSPASVRGCAVL